MTDADMIGAVWDAWKVGMLMFLMVWVFSVLCGVVGFNPVLIPANIIVGIGFLGAGSIILQGNRLMGLTSAAGFWVTAALGIACGFGVLSLAIISTVLVLIIFILLNIFEKPIKKFSGDGEQK